jgi:hypothetical protein
MFEPMRVDQVRGQRDASTPSKAGSSGRRLWKTIHMPSWMRVRQKNWRLDEDRFASERDYDRSSLARAIQNNLEANSLAAPENDNGLVFKVDFFNKIVGSCTRQDVTRAITMPSSPQLLTGSLRRR